jgi:tRNA-specific 2-thiouridylase
MAAPAPGTETLAGPELPAGTPVVVGLSGGVDSAVAALLLRDAGCHVQGLYMANWDEDDSYCTAAQDYQDARACARELGITLHRVSFAREYRERVFADFLAEYRRGRTPNPDVLCNREIKFDLCSHYARRLGGQWFATGHYARLATGEGGPVLLRALDAAKDQSYFLCGVPRRQFADVLFPLGGLHKAEVRERALRAGLPVHAKRDSTGICFIGERPFAEFLAQYIAEQPGPIETAQGQVLGRHRGLPFYTLGQRSGLEIGGQSGSDGSAWYVARKVPERNALVVVPGTGRAALATQRLQTGPMNWLAAPPGEAFRAGVQMRHRQAAQPAEVRLTAAGGLDVNFDEPQWAVTPGQVAALFLEPRCLGGGLIEETI